MSRTRPYSLIAAFVMLTAPGTRAVQAAESPAANPAGLPALVRSARSGPWSAPSTWEGGHIPAPGARVQIRPGHTVRYDVNADQALRSIHLAGTLTFARDRDTRLDVGLLKIQPGADASENGFDCDAHLPALAPGQPRPTLEVGTAQQPIDARHTARIRLVYFEGMDKQSCPALVCCGGRMELHGAPMSRTWVKLGATARAGDTVITLAEAVTGWRIGDHVILTATQREPTGSTSGTFRPGIHAVQASREERAGQVADASRAALVAREADLACLVATKFTLGPAGRKGPAGAGTGRGPGTGAWVSARVGLWAAETAALRNAPGKDAAVVAVIAARTALAAAETAAAADPPDRAAAQTAIATARSQLTEAEAALARDAPNREATPAGIAAARAAIAAAEAAGIPTAPDQEEASKASVLQIVAQARQRHSLEAFTEERTIRAIDGATVTLDRPLSNNHRASGNYRGEVADLSRNVIVESADPAGERGHTMYHRGSAGSISYAEFRHLGKEGVLGRYSLHFHLVGDTMRGSSVVGASIWDSGNRWITIHGTNYLVVRDCVGYQSVGHGFYVEDGSEVYNVFDRNLAVQAYQGEPLPKQNLPFDTNDGAGYWWANNLNTFTRNVACECDGYGYRFEATPSEGFDLQMPVQQPDGSRKTVDIRTLPFVRFEENEAHSILYGLNLGEGVDSVGPDTRHPLIVRNTRIWNAQWAFRPNAPSMVVENMEIYGSRYGIFQPIYNQHAYTRLAIDQTEVPGGEPFLLIGRKPDGLEFPDEPRRGSPKASAAVEKGYPAEAKPAPAGAVAEKSLGAGKAPAEVRIATAEEKRRFGLQQGDPLADAQPGPPARLLSSTGFPQPLDPVDDLPPATVITFVGKATQGKLLVRGTTSDNGTVRRVLVNGREAKATAPNFAEWEIILDQSRRGELKLTARAEDSAGNVEQFPHELPVTVPR
jgi:hypothetical protein